MNKLEICMVLVLSFALLFTGWAIRDMEGQYVADRALTEAVQEYKAESNGWEQQFDTCSWELEQKNTIHLPVNWD